MSLWFVCAMAHAGEAPTDFDGAVRPGPFDRGGRELQVGGGFAISQNFHRLDRPQLNDTDVHVRLGLMVNSAAGSGIWRGNFEFLIEAFGGAVVKGPGNAGLAERNAGLNSAVGWFGASFFL